MQIENLKNELIKRKFLIFLLLNSILTFTLQLTFFIPNFKDEKDFTIVPIFTIITIVIIIVQYPFLKILKNWGYKSLIFWISMNSFLFLLGFFTEIGAKSFENGIKVIIYGNLLIIPYLFLGIIIVVNYLLRKQIF